MFFRRFRLSAGHLKKVLPGFSTAQDSTSSLIAVGLLSLCGLMQDFTEQLHLDRYTLFMQDYGGPVGFRMALAHPERIQAMIIQNAVSHEEGLSPLWAVRRSFWHAAASARASCTKRSDTPRVTISDITVPARASPVANEMIASPISKMTRGLRVAVSNRQSQPR